MTNEEKNSNGGAFSFFTYLSSLGPGVIVALTWLGPGDIVDASVAGSHFGYSLLWMLFFAVTLRYLFVSLIAKYQLCNPNGDGVIDGLGKLSKFYPPFLAIAAIVMGHAYCAYMVVGLGELTKALLGWGSEFWFALLGSIFTLTLVIKPKYRLIEILFKTITAFLTLAFIYAAIVAKPDFGNLLFGLLPSLPESSPGSIFTPTIMAASLFGTLVGSVMNLVYPYFVHDKGWRGPESLKIQRYDLLFGCLILFFINVLIWILGAEVLQPQGIKVESAKDLPFLLQAGLGKTGAIFVHFGIIAAIFTSLLGFSTGLSRVATHAIDIWRRPDISKSREELTISRKPVYQATVVWCLFSPLVWTLPGMPGFVVLTVFVNMLQIVLLPAIAIGIWMLTSKERFIGREWKNGMANNILCIVFTLVSLIGAGLSISKAIDVFFG